MSRLGRRLEPCRSTRASAAERLLRCGGRESSSVRSSVQAASAMGDCGVGEVLGQLAQAGPRLGGFGAFGADADEGGSAQDRKSTRLNSSHVSIAYAVSCLKT